MHLKYLIADCIVFEPFENSIYIYRTNRKEITKHEIGENSKDVLLELIESKKCLSTEELLENIWRNKRKSEVDITSVRQAVSKLRKSFSFVAPEIDIIKTIPRKGYLLNAKVTLLDECSNHKRHPLGIVFLFLITCVSVLLSFYGFSYYHAMKSDKTTFAQIEAFKSPPQGLKIIHPEQHPINKELLPLIEQCISELNTSKADTILVHSRSDSYLSFTVFYEKPIKKHYTLRLILSYSSDGKRSYKCSGF